MNLNHCSVIVPFLNEEAALTKLADRLTLVRRLGAELILVDGGSDDNSVKVVKPHVEQLLQSRRGRAIQMNAGGQVAKKDWLFFLHADTELPGEFESQLHSLRCSSVSWGFFRVRLSGRDRRLRIIERMINWRSGLTGIGTGDQLIFVKRELFEALGGFADQPLMEDVELCRRLKKIAGRPHIMQYPVITSSRRWESNGVINTVLLMWRLRWAYWRGVKPEKLVEKYYPDGRKN